jgi:hypothetical protein
VSGEVLWGRTDGDGRLEHLQTDLGPFAEGLELNTTVHQGLGEVSSSCSQRVGSDGDGSRRLVGFEKGKRFVGVEQFHELAHEERVVAKVRRNVVLQLQQVV